MWFLLPKKSLRLFPQKQYFLFIHRNVHSSIRWDEDQVAGPWRCRYHRPLCFVITSKLKLLRCVYVASIIIVQINGQLKSQKEMRISDKRAFWFRPCMHMQLYACTSDTNGVKFFIHSFIHLLIQQPLKKRIISRCGKNKNKNNNNKKRNKQTNKQTKKLFTLLRYERAAYLSNVSS